MKPGQVFENHWPRSNWHFTIAFLAIATVAFPFLAGFPQNPQRQSLQDTVQPIYSDSSNDSWNRIFYCLFTRRVATRVSSEYPEGAPFTEFRENSTFRVSIRTIDRLEIGDRAIDSIYPNFFNTAGVRVVLTEPKYFELVKALQDALNENAARSPVARALMQSDLWSAFDQLYGQFTAPDLRELEQRRRVLADLLGRMIKKVALTAQEIQSLPANYSAAIHRQSLPDIFNKASGWVEILWFPHRLHEDASNDRRVARVFLKPTHPSRDLQKFVDDLRKSDGDPILELDGVALVMQPLLVDTQGNLRPTSLTTDVQVRLFEKTASGALKSTKIQVAEISRRLFMVDPASGGLAAEAEDSPAYFPSSGNDYTFAAPQIRMPGPPVQVHLRTRCTFCHGEDLTQVMTFSFALPPRMLTPRIRQLDPSAHQEADYVASQKQSRKDFNILRTYFVPVSK